MTINEIQDQIIEDFSYYEDWMEKYEHIISLGKELPLIEEQYKTEVIKTELIEREST